MRLPSAHQAGAALALSASLSLAPPARGEVFESVDHAGDCYGKPVGGGKTRAIVPGKAYELEAYGSEYGHHCKADQGRFVYQEVDGDFDVAVRVAEVRNDRHTAAKACLMVRERADDPSARFAAIMAISDLPFARRHHHGFPDSFTFDFRVRPGGNLGNDGFRYAGLDLKERRRYPNVWLRLVRRGDRITAFVGKDGARWTEIPPEDSWVNLPSFPLGKRVALGMCLSAEPEVKPDVRAVARFDRLRGFRAQGPARLPSVEGGAGAPVAFEAPPLAPKPRPLGLGKDLPLGEAKLAPAADGAVRSLRESAGRRGTLLVFRGTACERQGTPDAEVRALARAFAGKGVQTVVIEPAGAPAVPSAAEQGNGDALPLLRDDGALAKALGATAAGQAFLFDDDLKLAYSGAIAGRNHAGKPRPFLREALEAVAAGRPVEVAQSPAPDCPLLPAK